MSPPTRIISGGQTGADRGGLDAAIELGIAHGGYCPRGRRAEDGVIPRRYMLVELASTRYGERTEANVRSADATVVFTSGAPPRPGSGTALTVALCRKFAKPCLVVDAAEPLRDNVSRLHDFFALRRVEILNVAGPRASQAEGLAEAVRVLLVAAFR